MINKICFILLCTIFILFDFSDAQNYCSIQSCQRKGVHTMCAYTNTNPSGRCGAVTSVGLSNEDRNTILNQHNQYRRKVASGAETRGLNGQGQPAARSMPDLVWDYELENIAQRWANQCNYRHDDCRDTANYQVGQNIAQSWASGNASPTTMQGLVQAWYDEVAVYDPRSVDRFTSTKNARNEDIGHYTQIAWANTRSVGCGKINYNLGDSRYIYLVCNYGPAGNFLNQPVYIRR